MTRKTTKSPPGRTRKPSRKAAPVQQRPAGALDKVETEKPITAFSENVGASWPTPDNLDNASAKEEQSGIEDVRRDSKGRPRGR